MTRSEKILLGCGLGVGLVWIASLCVAFVLLFFSQTHQFPGNLQSSADRAAKTLAPTSRSDYLNLPFTRGAPPSTFDPALASDTSSAEIIVEIFSGLVTVDQNLQISPDLAESWTLSDDRKTYTFKLCTDGKFQDGKPITAQDFKYSIERATNPTTQSPVARNRLSDIVGAIEKLDGRAGEVSGVQVIDEHTVQITIDSPKSYFLAQLATTPALVVDRQNVEQGGKNWFLKPNGSGAYRLVEYSPNRRIVLEHSDYYCGKPKPSVKSVTYSFDSSGSFVNQYLQGNLDSALVHAYETNAIFAPNNSIRQEVVIAPTFRLEYIGMNNKLPPFDDIKIRQAFNLAIDKRSIADGILQRTAIPANGILHPDFPGFNSNLKEWEFDALKARQLIKESKYGDVKNLPKITLTVSGPNLVTDAIIPMIRQNLGIDVAVRQIDFAKMLGELESHPMPLQMYSLGRVPELADPVYMDPLFHSQGGNNYMDYSNASVDVLFEKARIEPDKKERFSLYQQAEQIIVNDAPWIPLFFGDNYWLTKPYVKNLYYPPLVIPRLKYVSVTP